jgi:hypothetical protein
LIKIFAENGEGTSKATNFFATERTGKNKQIQICENQRNLWMKKNDDTLETAKEPISSVLF